MERTATLILTWHHLHPPRGGAALRNWQNVRALAERGPVDVVSIGTGAGGEPPPPVRRWRHFDLAHLPAVSGTLARLRRGAWWLRPRLHPWSMALWRPEIRAAVTELVREGETDLVVLEELWLHPYHDLAHALGCRTVFDAHNVETRLRSAMSTATGVRERLRARRLAHQVAAIERDLARRADQVWCCSEEDARLLEETGARPVHVVPNTVDVDSYLSVASGSPAWRIDPHRPVVAFVGAYSYPPNEQAARLLVEEVLPALEHRCASVELLLVGRDPAPWMLEAQHSRRGVHVTGAVEDVRPHLARASVVAVPLTVGGGTRLKILEAFAAGRPVVSTPKGAEGLEVTGGEHLVLSEIEGFAEAILRLLAQPDQVERMVGSALELVNARYGWPHAALQIRLALAELT